MDFPTHKQAQVFMQVLFQEARVRESFFLMFPGLMHSYLDNNRFMIQPLGKVREIESDITSARESVGDALILLGMAMKDCRETED